MITHLHHSRVHLLFSARIIEEMSEVFLIENMLSSVFCILSEGFDSAFVADLISSFCLSRP